MASSTPISWIELKNFADIYEYLLSPETASQISDDEKSKIKVLEATIRNDPWQLIHLIGMFAEKYKIWLYIILNNNNQFQAMNEKWPLNDKTLKSKAFLIFSSTCTMFGIGSYSNECRRIVIFDINNMIIDNYIRQAIDELNEQISCSEEAVEQRLNNYETSVQEMIVDDISTTTNSYYPRTTDLNQYISNTQFIEGYLNELDFSVQSFQQRPISPPPPDFPVSRTVNILGTDIDFTSKPNEAQPPELLEELPKTMRARYLKCLSRKECSILLNKSGQPIQISVPEPDEKIAYLADKHSIVNKEVSSLEVNALATTTDGNMYLAVTALTVDNEVHPSIVIVPENVTVAKKNSYKDNNLDCLQFGRCKPMNDCVVNERTIYSKITEDEHQRGSKDVRIRMFKLYHDNTITKQLIHDQQLERFKLAFQYFIRRDDRYVCVSNPTYSSAIKTC